ncbi:MAG: RluA family pseudouridine synthase [Bdellovibrionaceae bacterium]|nr:RluA family pseudouridine synthase [Bdellovibrio sp.]
MAQLISSQGFEYGVKHFINPKSGSLLNLISEILDKPESEVSDLLKLGAVYVNNVRHVENSTINENQTLRVHTKPRRFNCEYDWSQRIVFECDDFILLNKPAGVPSHPSVDNVLDNSLFKLSEARQVKLHITHRLDTMTEGLIVYGKTLAFVKNFNFQMSQRQIEKKYVALIETKQTLPEKIIHYMEPSPRAPKTVSPVAHEGWAFCELHILKQKKHALGSWVQIQLLTGRTHQIRSQLAQLGAPLLGDEIYGSKTAWKPRAIALRACELQFNWNNQSLKFNLDETFED